MVAAASVQDADSCRASEPSGACSTPSSAFPLYLGLAISLGYGRDATICSKITARRDILLIVFHGPTAASEVV